jgi:1-acyl-sn-glycerol-3-phosphate acyltransferase
LFYQICRSLIRFFFSVFCAWKVDGEDNLPQEGAVLVVANHFSYWDPVVVGCALRRQVYFMAKSNLFSYPVLGFLLRKLGAFPVNRRHVDRTSLKTALALLSEERIVCLFPEGTRGRQGQFLPPLPGAAFLACKAGVPICPVALVKKKRLLGNNIFPCYHVKVGAVFSMNKEGKRDYQTDADFMMAKIKELIEFSI